MFGIDSAELLIIAVVALVVIGPKDLPRVLRTVGNFVAKARGMASHFRLGMDNMIRETELADLDRQWKEQNERIMQQYPAAASTDSDWGAAPPTEAPAIAGPAPIADAGEVGAAPPPPRPTSARVPRRAGPRPPATGRRPPLPPRPGELP